MTTPDAFFYTVTVLRGGKQWLNSNQRPHWAIRSRQTKAWRTEAALAAGVAGIPRQVRVWVVAELAFAGQRRRDAANWYPTVKACVDGLVDARVLPDDDVTHLVGPDMRIADAVGDQGQEAVRLLIYPTEGLRWNPFR